MTTASLSSLPLELIQEVVANHQAVPLHTSDPYYDSLEPPPALHPLLLVNSAFYHAVVPVLWRHIDTSRMSNLSVMRLQDVLIEKLSIFRTTGALSVCCCSSEYCLKEVYDACFTDPFDILQYGHSRWLCSQAPLKQSIVRRDQ